MRYALIKDNKVDNIIKASAEFVSTMTGYDAIVETNNAGIGWEYIDGQIVTPEPEEPEFVKVTTVSMRQARLALLHAGLLKQVEATLDMLEEPARSAAKIEWEYSQEVKREWPWVVQLTAAMGMTDEQVDGLFQLAATL